MSIRGTTKQPVSLFDIPEPHAPCELYRALRDAINSHCKAAREHCDELWRAFARHADEHFVAAFPWHLHERWFEMYLTIALERAGFQVHCPKPGPDIAITVDGRRVWIEATCAGPGAVGSPDSVPPPVYADSGEMPTIQGRPVHQSVLRILSSLDTKDRAFRRYRENGLIAADDITLVAINVFQIPGAWGDVDDLFQRALFGRAGKQLWIRRETDAVVRSEWLYQEAIAKQSSGKPVTVVPFADGSRSGVSGVIASGTDVLNRDWPPARLGASMVLFPNMTACVQYPPGLIPLGVEFKVERDHPSGWCFTEVDHERIRGGAV